MARGNNNQAKEVTCAIKVEDNHGAQSVPLATNNTHKDAYTVMAVPANTS
jgi:hypothetical protein